MEDENSQLENQDFWLECSRSYIKDVLFEDAQDDDDDRTSLGKALIILIILNTDNDSPTINAFLQELLKDFAPLRNLFDSDGNLSIGNTAVHLRHLPEEENLIITLGKEFMQRLPGIVDANFIAKHLYLKDYLEEDWPIITRRYVAFLDIMGFKSLVKDTKDSATLYQLMVSIHDVIKDTEAMSKGFSEGFDVNEGKVVVLSSQKRNSRIIKTVQFSDSFILFSKDDSDASEVAIMLAAFKIFLFCLSKKIIFRGALAFGEVCVDFEKEIFFGQPIIDAYELGERPGIYGIVAHESFNRNGEKRRDFDDSTKIKPIDKDQETPIMAQVEIPMKHEIKPAEIEFMKEDLDAIDWPMLIPDLKTLKKLLKPWSTLGKTNPKLGFYYENTMKFAQAHLRGNTDE